MKKIGLMKVIKEVYQYEKMSNDKRHELQKKQFYKLVRYTKENSPYYKKLYSNINEIFEIEDLPVTNKKEMMLHFDEWLTVRDVQLSEIYQFTKDFNNVGKKFKGKYLIFTTSGSTGNPSVVLYDETARSVMVVISMLRSYARKEDFKAFIKKGKKTAGIYATKGFYLANGIIFNTLKKIPWKKKQMLVVGVLDPITEIVEKLNKFKPAKLEGYTTALELLIHEKNEGRLKISPAIIMTGGEQLSDRLRQKLIETFQCSVQTNYACTEGGVIAYECREGHLHINDDWLIIEPVDKNNKPVKEGVISDKILLTNLSNFTQPMIRFEITDRVIKHSEKCSCGNRLPWLEIEGRTDDILVFHTESGKVKISPLALYALLKEVPHIKRFQLIQLEGNNLELCLMCSDNFKEEDVFFKAKEVLEIYLKNNGITSVNIELSKKLPMPDPKSGKFKHVYRMNC